MSDHKSDSVDLEEEEVEHQLAIDLRRFLGRHKIRAFNWNSKDLREWLAILDRNRTVHGLSERQTLYLAREVRRQSEGTLS